MARRVEGMVVYLFLIILFGCGDRDGGASDTEKGHVDDSDPQGDTDTDAGTLPGDTVQEPPTDGDTASDHDTATSTDGAPPLFDTYGILSTVAGACAINDKGVNGWQDAFEGGAALDAELSRPHFAMADDAGNIYVADKDAHGIRKISPDGAIVTVAGTSVAGDGGDGPGVATEMALSSPNGLWVRGDGTVYIVDLGNSKIRKLTPDGEMTTLFTDTGGISLGRSIWMNDDETLCFYASGSTAKRWTPDEGITVAASGFSGLGALVVDPEGRLVVTDRVGNRVYRVGDDGTKIPIAGTGSAEASGGGGFPALDTALSGVRGVWFLDDGGYFLATHEGSQVWYVDTAGIIHLFLDGQPDDVHAGDGERFDTPGPKVSEVRGISVDADGNVIITENDCGYIRKVAKINN